MPARIAIVRRSGLSHVPGIAIPEPLREGPLRELVIRGFGLREGEIELAYSTALLTNAIAADVSGTSDPDDQAAGRVFRQMALGRGPRERIALALYICLAADFATKLEQRIQRLDSVVWCSRDMLARACIDCVAKELVKIAADTARFEAKIALENGLIARCLIEELPERFLELCADREYQSYLESKYSVLFGRVQARSSETVRAFELFIARLDSDSSRLADVFGLRDTDEVVQLDRTAGDSHNGADAVTVLQFRSGVGVVYKPRSVSPEAAFNRFLAWFNSIEPRWSLKLLCVLDSGTHGWTEFVGNDPVADEAAIGRYFERYGALMAIANALNSTDLHYENLIAHGEQPVLVDLETILQPVELALTSASSSRFVMDLDLYVSSVMFTAMIDPVFLNGSLNGSPLAIGVKAGVGHEISFNECGELVETRRPSIEVTSHCVRLGDRVVAPFAYVDRITGGYRAAFSVLFTQRAFIVSDLLDNLFGDVCIRVIFRSTAKYFNMLSALNSAYALESAVTQDEFLTKLWLAAVKKQSLEPVAISEYSDLFRGDVPYFRATASSVDVHDTAGQLLPGVFRESGLAVTKRRLLAANSASVAQDAACIEYSLARKQAEPDDQSMPDAADFTAQLELIERRVLWSDSGELRFTDLVMQPDLSTRHAPLDYHFYNGAAGLAFALAYFGKSRPGSTAKATACRIFDSVMKDFDSRQRQEIGICHGVGGLVYLSAHLGHLESKQYLAAGKYLAERAREIVSFDRLYDVFSGAAGAILGVLALHAVTKDEHLLEIVEVLSEHLLRSSSRNGGRRVWVSSIPASGPTTGFAHGVSGIGYALLSAYEVLGRTRLLDAAREASAFVASCFRPETNTWTETVDSDPCNQIEVWCHGAPGIVNFYDKFNSLTGEHDFAHYLACGSASTAMRAVFENDSLCHGSLGNVDLFITMLRRGQVSDAGQRSIDAVLETLRNRAPLCGNLFKHHSVGLFTGIAGSAYQLLRLGGTVSLPSVLRFEAPIVA